VTEEQKRRYKEILVKNLWKERTRLDFEIEWDNIAPEDVRANEEQKQKFVNFLLSKAGKVNKEQFEKEIREIGGDQMLKAMHARMLMVSEACAEGRTPEGARKEEARTQKCMESQHLVRRGIDFTEILSRASDAHYVGKGVSPGTTDKPIFWYRPHDSKKYRVIYADFSVREADSPPAAVDAQQAMPAPSSPKQ
jgi:hypothetical protein